MIDNSLVDTSDPTRSTNNLKLDAIEDVKIVETQSTRHYNGYNEQPHFYKVRLKGEKIWRRIYLTPLGNVSVVYLKSEGSLFYCETALEEAVMRKDEGDAFQLSST